MKPRRLLLLILIGALLPALSHAKDIDHNFRPITDQEKQIFYPMICNAPANKWPDWDHACDTLPSPHQTKATTIDDPALIAFNSIAYGSFTQPGMDEAIISFRTNLTGEQHGGAGSALFRRENSKWSLVDFELYGDLNNCVVFTEGKRQEMLCMDAPLGCCMQASGSVNVTVWGEDTQTLLSYHAGAITDERDEKKKYCAAGTAGKTLLWGVNNLKPSHEPGIIAQADVEYVLPEEIKRMCRQKPFNDEPRYKQGQVRFTLDGDHVKAVLPHGVRSFSAY